jgi:hypothetical protein
MYLCHRDAILANLQFSFPHCVASSQARAAEVGVHLHAWCLSKNWHTGTVNSTPRIHLQFDISTKAFEIRAVQSLKCVFDVLLSVHTTLTLRLPRTSLYVSIYLLLQRLQNTLFYHNLLLLPTLIPLSGIGTSCFHHVIKIRHLFLRPAACWRQHSLKLE